MWALSNLTQRGLGPSFEDEQLLEGFVDCWCEEATRRIEHFTSQELANSLFAIGRMHIYITPDFMRAWKRAAVDKLPQFSIPELCQIGESLGRIDPKDEFLEEWEAVVTGQLHKFSPRALVNIIYPMMLIRGDSWFNEEVPFFQTWFEATAPRLREIRTQGIAMVIYALSKSRIKHVPVNFAHEWFAAATQKMDLFSPQGLMMCLHGVSYMSRVPVEKRFIQTWYATAMNVLLERGFKSNHLGSIMNSLRRLVDRREERSVVIPPRHFMRLFAEEYIAILHTQDHDAISKSAAVLKELGYHHEKAALLRRAESLFGYVRH